MLKEDLESLALIISLQLALTTTLNFFSTSSKYTPTFTREVEVHTI
ncbi:MAG: hypothetical protein R8M38_04305 [Mariprofundaceae bacterium]